MNFEEFERLVQQDKQRLRDEGRVEGRVEEAQRAVARVLARRALTLTPG